MSSPYTIQQMTRPPSGVRLFGWVRARQVRASARALARTPVKLGVMVVMWVVLFTGLYLLAYQGIRFVNEAAGLGPFLLSRLWFLFLFVVMLMLAVSQIASAYATLIRAPETRWWMVLPVSARTLCRIKWLESSFYSAWAVVVLVLPMCLAYLVVLKKSLWIAGALLGALLVPLLIIVTALATIGLLIWLRWLGRVVIRRELLPVGFVLAAGALFWLLGEQQHQTSEDVWFVALQALLPRMQIAMSPWLPSSWAATALDALLTSRWVEAALYTGLLWTTALVCWRALDHLAAGLLLPVLRQSAHAAQAAPSRRSGNVTADRASMHAAGRWMRGPLSAALTKDILLVLRDPVQWSQAVMFFGLLGAYFANIHRLASFSGEPSWRLGIAALNLACTLLVFGSLAVRFIYPQMSLEGKSLWILRVAPNGLRYTLFSKLCLYGTLAVAIIDTLLMLSAQRLAIAIPMRWWLAAVGVVAGITLVALTVGCGAWWMDPTAQDAARVVSSSNGALVLVLMLCYVGCVVAALLAAWGASTAHDPTMLLLASAGLAAISAIASWVPMRQGLRQLEQFE